jgi:hypothetical protein
MKEVFSKSFWQGVKKTFDQALEDPPPAENAQIPAEDGPSGSSTSATPSSATLSASATSSAPEVPGGTNGTGS